MNVRKRLDNILSNSGFGTRTQVKKIIKFGLVIVDDKVIKDPAFKVNPELALIEVDGEKLIYHEYIYIMMNKPAGVISATYDSSHRTCIDLLEPELQRKELFPAGRLDIDTEGLLLLTNDGQLAHNILSPKKHVPKKYHVVVTGEIDQTDILAFEEGVVLDDGYKTLQAELRVLAIEAEEAEAEEQSEQSEAQETSEQPLSGYLSTVEVIIREGKFHQIKRMFEALNKKVVYLKRIKMGSLALDKSLKLGEYRELRDNEMELLVDISGGCEKEE